MLSQSVHVRLIDVRAWVVSSTSKGLDAIKRSLLLRHCHVQRQHGPAGLCARGLPSCAAPRTSSTSSPDSPVSPMPAAACTYHPTLPEQAVALLGAC